MINWITTEDGHPLASVDVPSDGRVHVTVEPDGDQFVVVTSAWDGTTVEEGFPTEAVAKEHVERVLDPTNG